MIRAAAHVCLWAFVAVATAEGLSACAHLAPPEPPPRCLPLRAYTPQQQQALAAALDALPDASPLLPAFADYAALRDADRACLSVKP